MSDGGKSQRPTAAAKPARAVQPPAAAGKTTPLTLPARDGLDAEGWHERLQGENIAQQLPPNPWMRMQAERTAIAGDVQRRLAVQRKAGGAARPGAAQIPTSGGAPLPGDVKARMGSQLGAELSGVRVFTGDASNAAAGDLGARAFTVGSDVHFAAGEFAPGTREGDKLLAHELTHTVQAQRSGVQRKADDGAHGDGAHGDGAHGGLEVSQPGEPAEQEADATADRVAGNLHDGRNTNQPAAGKEAAPPIAAKLAGVGRKIFRAKNDKPKQAKDTKPVPPAKTTPATTSSAATTSKQAGTPPKPDTVKFKPFSQAAGTDTIEIADGGAHAVIRVAGAEGGAKLTKLAEPRLFGAKNQAGYRLMIQAAQQIQALVKPLADVTITNGEIPKSAEATIADSGAKAVAAVESVHKGMSIDALQRAAELKPMDPAAPALVFKADIAGSTAKYKQQFMKELDRQLVMSEEKINGKSVDEFVFGANAFRIDDSTFQKLDSSARVAVIEERQKTLKEAQAVARGKDAKAKKLKQQRDAAANELDRSGNANRALNQPGQLGDVPDRDILAPMKPSGRRRNIGAEGRNSDNRPARKDHAVGMKGMVAASQGRANDDEVNEEFEDWSALVRGIDDLVVIHTPDQIAGGPGNVEPIDPLPDADTERINNTKAWKEYVIKLKKLFGPKAVNEAIGKGWEGKVQTLLEHCNTIPQPAHPIHQMKTSLKGSE